MVQPRGMRLREGKRRIKWLLIDQFEWGNKEREKKRKRKRK